MYVYNIYIDSKPDAKKVGPQGGIICIVESMYKSYFDIILAVEMILKHNERLNITAVILKVNRNLIRYH